jgi:hypothetical protein
MILKHDTRRNRRVAGISQDFQIAAKPSPNLYKSLTAQQGIEYQPNKKQK